MYLRSWRLSSRKWTLPSVVAKMVWSLPCGVHGGRDGRTSCQQCGEETSEGAPGSETRPPTIAWQRWLRVHDAPYQRPRPDGTSCPAGARLCSLGRRTGRLPPAPCPPRLSDDIGRDAEPDKTTITLGCEIARKRKCQHSQDRLKTQVHTFSPRYLGLLSRPLEVDPPAGEHIASKREATLSVRSHGQETGRTAAL